MVAAQQGRTSSPHNDPFLPLALFRKIDGTLVDARRKSRRVEVEEIEKWIEIAQSGLCLDLDAVFKVEAD
jgi:hypothetical protein